MKRQNSVAKATAIRAAESTVGEAAPTSEAEPRAPLTLAIVEPTTVDVALADLDPARYVTARVSRINERTVDAYAERMIAGDAFPSIELFRDEAGSLWVGDGIHRIEASRKNGLSTILARVSDGGSQAALLHAVRANSAHGLRRTNQDKRRAVELVLQSFPEWSDRQIGDSCAVDGKTVASVRKATAELPQLGPRTGKDGKIRKSRRATKSTSKVKKGPTLNAPKVVDRVLALLGSRDRWDDPAFGKLKKALDKWERRSAPTGESPKPVTSEVSP